MFQAVAKLLKRLCGALDLSMKSQLLCAFCLLTYLLNYLIIYFTVGRNLHNCSLLLV